MRNYGTKIVWLLILIISKHLVYAQQTMESTFHGVVLEARSQNPIPGANIYAKDETKGCVTDANGKFHLEARQGETFTVSSIGFKSQTITLDKKHLTIELEKAMESLGEVQVVAKNINDIDMRKMAGAIESVDIKKLSSRPEINIANLLQGQVPGLVVTSTGELGTKPKVRIRGTSSFREGDAANEPLYVLDGMIISSEAFFTLNAEDFESIKVLKDAAATALYGVKAANGVIEITSKRGFEGKTQVSYRYNTGITFRGTRGVEMMDSEEKLELERLLKMSGTPGYEYSADYFLKEFPNNPGLDAMIANGQIKLDSLKNINTDWFKKLIINNRYSSHSLSLKGGTAKNKHYYSVKYDEQGGRVEGNSVQRFTGRMNLDYTLAKDLHLSFNTSAAYSLTQTPYGSSNNPTTLVYDLNPYEQHYNPVSGEPTTLYSYPNQTLDDLLNQYSSEGTSKRIYSSLNMNWRIAKGLDLSAIVGGDYLLKENTSIIRPDAYSQNIFKDAEKGELSSKKNTNFNFTSNYRLNFNRVWNKHDLTTSFSYDYFYESIDNLGIKGYGLASKVSTPAGINQGLEGHKRLSMSSQKQKTAQMGIGAALGYSYNGTYDIYGSYKADASSIMPADKRWNTAWSIGVGWELSNTEFIMNSSWISRLRLKASYGYTANLGGIAPSSVMPIYSYNADTYNQSRILDLNDYYNEDLKPEQARSYNFGIVIGLFDNLILESSVYRRTTEDALLSVNIPVSNGYSTMMRNVGVLKNEGIEFRLSGDLIDKNTLRWNSSISICYNQNEVLDLYDGKEYYSNNQNIIPDMQEGEPLDLIYGLESLGIHSIDGLPRYLSATGEQIDYTHNLTREDFKVLGYGTAPYTGFFNNTISYKSFTFNFDFYFSFGGIAKYNRSYVRDLDNANKNAVKGQTTDMWFKVGDENKIYHTVHVPSAAHTIISYYSSTKTVYKTDYLKLNSLSLSYRLPATVLAKTNHFVKYASISARAENLFTYRVEKDKASLNGIEQPVVTLGISLTF